jgi:Transcriptional regulatory protein, C terminal
MSYRVVPLEGTRAARPWCDHAGQRAARTHRIPGLKGGRKPSADDCFQRIMPYALSCRISTTKLSPRRTAVSSSCELPSPRIRCARPVLVLSAVDAVEDRVHALRAGGDDYLTKPFVLIELVARVEALVRRVARTRETMLRVGQLELDLIERTARRGARRIELLPREFRLLEYMTRCGDQMLTRAMLLKDIWNYKFVPKTNPVDVQMGRLRHKVDLPGQASMIQNVRGTGFILRATP